MISTIINIKQTLLFSNQMKKQSPHHPSSKKEIGDYVIGKTIGEGTFGKVKSATHKLTHENVAIKILDKNRISEVADVERVSRQIHILKLIRHPNIVQLYEIIETPKQLFLVMEFMENGELFDYIDKQKRINEIEACRMFHELIDGVQYIHKIGVVHRDLKPQNILLNYKKSLKIVDFGLSNTYKKHQLLKTPCGSPCYAAPEMIKGEKYEGLKVDIWSCGVILFAMLNGYLPFEDEDTPALYKKILSGSYTVHKSVSEQGRDLIGKILNGDHNLRYTIQQIRNHPWMKSIARQQSSQGIVIGFNRIPIDRQILQSMKQFSYDPDYVSKCLEANRHNNVTTTYYLALKMHLRNGGITSFDFSSKEIDKSNKEIDKSLMELNKRKSMKQNVVVENFFTRNSEGEVAVKRKSKDRDREREKDKENRMNNAPISNLATQTKNMRANSKNRINSSFNYGRIPLSSKSVDKTIIKRETNLQNRISRKYRQKFNQSLLSKSKEKTTQQRSRINSSINGMKKDLHQASTTIIEDYIDKKKKGGKKTCSNSNSIKWDPSKIIKAKRL